MEGMQLSRPGKGIAFTVSAIPLAGGFLGQGQEQALSYLAFTAHPHHSWKLLASLSPAACAPIPLASPPPPHQTCAPSPLKHVPFPPYHCRPLQKPPPPPSPPCFQVGPPCK